METQDELLARIVVNPAVMVGKPVIAGTRLPVEYILKLLAQGMTFDEVLAEYPHITAADLRACLAFASRTLSDITYMPAFAAPRSDFSSTNARASLSFDSLVISGTMS